MFHSKWQKTVCVPRAVKCVTVDPEEPVETSCNCPQLSELNPSFFLSTIEITVTNTTTNTAAFTLCNNGFSITNLPLLVNIFTNDLISSTTGSIIAVTDYPPTITFLADETLPKACVRIYKKLLYSPRQPARG
jgi:hypothetical protein